MAGLSGLTVKALPMLLDNAPEIWSAATQLIQSARRAKAEIVADAGRAEPDGGVGPAALDAAIRDIEASLLALNGQMEKSGALVASLARQNELLASRLDKLQSWAVGLALLGGVGFALALGAVLVVLAR